jgi:lipopolysaccharide transport system ATP-binding protein
MGMSPREVESRLPQIEAFAEIGAAWSRPVKTYSSGMFVRLAFSVSTAIEPDLLIIDEALSVGDAAFSRKSFDRIMALREQGVTLIFCTHALYQVEMLCEQAVWLDQGTIMAHGNAASVVAQYNEHLKLQEQRAVAEPSVAGARVLGSADRLARVKQVSVLCNNQACTPQQVPELRSNIDELGVLVHAEYDQSVPAPTVAVVISDATGMHITSCTSFHDRVAWRATAGALTACVRVPTIPLMRGEFTVDVFLMCERAIHVYEHVVHAARFNVIATGAEVGLVRVPHHWEQM